MADENENIDALFRDKLAGHAEKPSPLAWYKLEERLFRERKNLFLPWMRIAASVLLVVGLVCLSWFSFWSIDKELYTVAHQEPVPGTSHGKEPEVEPLQDKRVLVEKEETIVQPAVKAPPKAKHASTDKELKLGQIQGEENEKETVPTVEIDILDLPPLGTDLLVADYGLVEQKKRDVDYTVTIISNGLTERPEKENLVNGIENKIDQLGGLLSKVDQGLADLQDAKNGWFTNLTTRKENNKN